MVEVRWSLTATDDLQRLEDFIARDSTLHAVHFINRIVEAGERLEQAPLRGRIVPEFGLNNLRELLFSGYRIVYLFRDDRVTIIRVVHGARPRRTRSERTLADRRITRHAMANANRQRIQDQELMADSRNGNMTTRLSAIPQAS